MQNELLTNGLSLMLLGMGVVFVFLALLVVITTLMSKVVEKYFPEPLPPDAPPDTPSTSLPSPRTLAIIRAAVAEHRNKTGQ